VSALLQEKEPELEDKAVTELTEYKEDLVDKLDTYLDETSKEFVETHKPEIQDSLKVSVYEDLINHIQEGFRKFNVKIPESEMDFSIELKEDLETAESRINSLMQENMELKNEILKEKCLRIRSEKTKNISDMDKAKLDGLMDSVEFEDELVFEQKLDTMISKFLGEEINDENIFNEDLESLHTDFEKSKNSNEKYVNEWNTFLK
jgi:vacuolar-type H+-ATPase subunit H